MAINIYATTKDTTWWLYTLPHLLPSQTLIPLLITFLTLTLITYFFTPGGPAWKNSRTKAGKTLIPGPRGFPIFGTLFTLTHNLTPHVSLSHLSSSMNAKTLMAFSLGSTPAVITSDPQIAKEILTSVHFADRPVKQSARTLMFTRAIGFAPNGTYWRLLRKIAASHLFAPRRVLAHEGGRLRDCEIMVENVGNEMRGNGRVELRKHLQDAALGNIMGCVFGKRYDTGTWIDDMMGVNELKEMVREGFELLGAFNWSDYLPWLSGFYDRGNVVKRCESLVPRVRHFVMGIIDEHRIKKKTNVGNDCGDFVDVLISLEGDEKLSDDDMIAVLWEMIFRGTDTTALLTEWIMAELVLHPEVQTKLRKELDEAASHKKAPLTDADLAGLPYLQAVIKETLRIHPPGPLLSWARLSMSDVQLSNGMVVPASTTAMVNMWAITHDASVWEAPLEFRPERFVVGMGGADVDVRGGDLRLAPFGAGRRVCPGKNLGMVTVAMWVAQLVKGFVWKEVENVGVDLSEVLKLSCEMKYPLTVVVEERNV